jgi:hypothetical protein
MFAHRRHRAAILLAIAVAAVVLFGLGLTLCIDWGGASVTPHDLGQPALLVQPFL